MEKENKSIAELIKENKQKQKPPKQPLWWHKIFGVVVVILLASLAYCAATEPPLTWEDCLSFECRQLRQLEKAQKAVRDN